MQKQNELEKKIKRVGNTKSGYWEVLKCQEN